MLTTIRPFLSNVPDAVLTDLKERLDRTRFPDQLPGDPWEYGTSKDYLIDLCRHWSTRFDWRAAEARINAFPQYLTEIDGEQVHFYHVRSPEPDAMPIIITHGWPGSVVEFLDILGPLSDPARYGGDPADAFHVVAPSIPGYGFSGPTRTRGFTVQRAAEVNATLMQRLGYDRYAAQGGDWGATISTLLAAAHPDRLTGLHLNLIFGRPADAKNPLNGVTEQELADMKWREGYDREETDYFRIQGTKPQSLAYGMTDSPAGLAGWMIEKFRAWSDCAGSPDNAFTKDRLLENVMVYWVTGTINSSMRLYYESLGPGRLWKRPDYVSVPTGYTKFPYEMMKTPRCWAETCYNIQSWTTGRAGGHFAAMEQPALFVEELRTFFRTLRA